MELACGNHTHGSGGSACSFWRRLKNLGSKQLEAEATPSNHLLRSPGSLAVWVRILDMVFKLKTQKKKNLVSTRGFYPQQASCQIGTLWWLYSFFLGEKNSGWFIEVGAYDGVFVSNSWGLAAKSWRGILIEPIPEYADLARQNHKHHPLVSVIESAVGPPEMGGLDLAIGGTLTTANRALEAEYDSVPWARGVMSGGRFTAPVRSLDSVLEEFEVPENFEVLIVDVEGFESEVFESFNIGKFLPKMIIVELVDTHPDLGSTTASDALLGDKISSHGYAIVYKDSINTVYVENTVREKAFFDSGQG